MMYVVKNYKITIEGGLQKNIGRTKNFQFFAPWEQKCPLPYPNITPLDYDFGAN